MDRHTNVNRQTGRWLHASLSESVAYLQGRNSGTRNLCHFCSVPACEMVVIFSPGLTNEAFYLGHLSSQMGHQLCQCAAFQCSSALRSQGKHYNVQSDHGPRLRDLRSMQVWNLHHYSRLRADTFIFHQNALRFALFKDDWSLQMSVTVGIMWTKKYVLYDLEPVLQVSLLFIYKADIFVHLIFLTKACLCIRLCTGRWVNRAF